MFGHFESVLSDRADRRPPNDALILSTLPGRRLDNSLFTDASFKIIESAILACIFTKVLSIKEEDEQEEMLKYSEGAEKSKFQRQIR